ncbi:glycoside hydrolase family 39 protein [Trichoderma barbatum]
MVNHLLLLSCVAGLGLASKVTKRQSQTATVNLGQMQGAPQHFASGFLYGVPDTPNQIPAHFYSEIAFNYGRAGGAQLPAKGYMDGIEQYKPRFASMLSNYRTCRQFGAEFIILLHDLWGADGSESQSDLFPGDNGDWTTWNNFLHQIVSDMRANNATTAIKIDIWNEADGGGFWLRDRSQFMEMYARTHSTLRSILPEAQIFGPTFTGQPDPNNIWWTDWMRMIASKNVIPDVYCWHLIRQPGGSGGDDITYSRGVFEQMLQQFGLPSRPINIDEYGSPEEQVPASSAWFMARFERNNIHGLRSVWTGGPSLHDFMTDLLGRTGDGVYFPAGEWQVYRYYGTNMTGNRVATTPSADGFFDVYATASDRVRILGSAHTRTGSYTINVDGMADFGFNTQGTVNVQTREFRFAGLRGVVNGPIDHGVATISFQNNRLVIPATISVNTSAYAWEVFRI